jgi:hypothetical protein
MMFVTLVKGWQQGLALPGQTAVQPPSITKVWPVM